MNGITELPKQLQREEFRFVPIYKGEKRPIGNGWQTVNNHGYSDIIPKIEGLDAYGVVCGFGNLYVIDFDDKALQEVMLPKLPDTFTVKSGGKGLLHLYFINPDGVPFSFKIIKGDITLADIQGKGKQIIGAYSIHCRTGNKYEIVKDIPIAEFPLSKIQGFLKEYEIKYFRAENSTKRYCSKLIKCIFHDDRTPSLAIYKDTNTFYCFGCGAFGFLDVLNCKGEIKQKKTRSGTQYYIKESDIEKYRNMI